MRQFTIIRFLLVIKFLTAASLWSPCWGANRLVTRDDFALCDSTFDNQTDAIWPAIAISADGTLRAIFCTFTRTPQNQLVHQYWYATYDSHGNASGKAQSFSPDTTGLDSVWVVNSLTTISTTESGLTFVPYLAGLESDRKIKGLFGLFYQPDGSVLRDPILLTNEPVFDAVYLGRPSGAIGAGGTAAIAWRSQSRQFPKLDSVKVRLCRADSKRPGLVISPMVLPDPLMPVDGYRGDYRVHNEPAVGVAADGSLAVAWVARYPPTPFAHVFFALFDADGSPRTDIRMADCSAGYLDTSSCVTSNVLTVAMAMEANGDFYLAWFDSKLGRPHFCDRKQIWMRGFNSNGTAKYDAVRVTDADSLWVPPGEYIYPQIACNDSGQVLMAWSDSRNHPHATTDSTARDVYVQRFNPEGRPLGPNLRCNNIPGIAGLHGAHVGCDLNNAGQAVIVWKDFRSAVPLKGQLMPFDPKVVTSTVVPDSGSR